MGLVKNETSINDICIPCDVHRTVVQSMLLERRYVIEDESD